MKRVIALLLSLVFVAVSIVGCANSSNGTPNGPTKAKELRLSLTISETSSWMVGAQY